MGPNSVQTFDFRPGTEIDEDYWQMRTADVHDFNLIANIPRGNVLLGQPDEVAAWLASHPEQMFAYVTGGLDCGPHHQQIVNHLGALGVGMIMGLEPSEYFLGKGSKERFPLEVRRGFWVRANPPPSAVFAVPTGTRDYDRLARTATVYRHPQIYHIASMDDPPDLIEARRQRAATPDHFLLIAATNHTTGIQVKILTPSRMMHSNSLV